MVKRTEAPPPAAPGAVENLADLAREATDLDVAERQASEQRQEQAERTEQRQAEAESAAEAKMLAAFLGKGRNMAAKLLDRLDKLPEAQTVEIWNDAALTDIAASLVAIPGEHLEWLQQLLAKYGPFLALAMSLGPPSWATYEAMRLHKANKAPVDVDAKEVKPDGQQ